MQLGQRITTRAMQLRAQLAEMDYARQRMMEIKTGYVYTEETRRRRARAEIQDLNRLFTNEPVTWSADGERDSLDAPDQDRRHDWPGLE